MGYPWGIFDSKHLVCHSSHREEQIAHAIDVLKKVLADRFRVRQAHNQALRSTADRPCQVKPRSELGSARHHKVLQGLVAAVDLIDPDLDFLDMRRFDPLNPGLIR
jgi:hypothetical protein